MSTDSQPKGKPEGAAAADTAAGEFDWFDRPKSRRLLWRLLYGACIVSVLLEIPLILAHKRHSHFEAHAHADHAAEAGVVAAAHPPTYDGYWFFYAVLGFVGCALMILAAKGLGTWLKKPEDYYGEPEESILPEDIDDALR